MFLDSTRAFGATVVAAAYSPRIRPGATASFPVRLGLPGLHRAGDFTVHSVREMLDGHAAWAGELPAPQARPGAGGGGAGDPGRRGAGHAPGQAPKRAREAQLAAGRLAGQPLSWRSTVR